MLKLIYYNNDLLLEKKGENYYIPNLEKLPIWIEKGKITYTHAIGIYNQINCEAIELSEKIDLPKSYEWISLRAALNLVDYNWYSVITRAYHTIHWDKNHRFCGRCGQETVYIPNTLERQCIRCQLFFYPRISPSIIVLIYKKNQILMARKAEFSPGVYGLIAGFVEPGETLEETLHREVQEEVGLKVKNINYFGSQPWPFPDSLMIAFTAEYAEGEIKLNDGELETADWFDIDHLPGYPSSSVSISRKLIDDYLKKSEISRALH
jgi:NAD+ diphosphatase